MIHAVASRELLVKLLSLDKLVNVIRDVLFAADYLPDLNRPEVETGPFLVRHLAELADRCGELELSVTQIECAKAIQCIRHSLQNDHADWGVHAIRRTNGVLNVLESELSLRLCFHLPERSRQQYQEQQPFGKTVFDSFPGANRDILEASKCLAFERGTACVMHCCRVVECGLVALWESLGRAIPKHANWYDLLSRISQQANEGKVTGSWSTKQGKLREIVAALDLMRDVLRNEAMHANEIYTLEEAEEVFAQSKSFMRRLAEELPEKNEAVGSDDAAEPRSHDSDAKVCTPRSGGDST